MISWVTVYWFGATVRVALRTKRGPKYTSRGVKSALTQPAHLYPPTTTKGGQSAALEVSALPLSPSYSSRT